MKEKLRTSQDESGIQISSSDIKTLFERVTRVDSSASFNRKNIISVLGSLYKDCTAEVRNASDDKVFSLSNERDQYAKVGDMLGITIAEMSDVKTYFKSPARISKAYAESIKSVLEKSGPKPVYCSLTREWVVYWDNGALRAVEKIASAFGIKTDDLNLKKPDGLRKSEPTF